MQEFNIACGFFYQKRRGETKFPICRRQIPSANYYISSKNACSQGHFYAGIQYSVRLFLSKKTRGNEVSDLSQTNPTLTIIIYLSILFKGESKISSKKFFTINNRRNLCADRAFPREVRARADKAARSLRTAEDTARGAVAEDKAD